MFFKGVRATTTILFLYLFTLSGRRESNSDFSVYKPTVTIATTTMLHLLFLCRGAENRTRTARSQTEYTTTMLRPVIYRAIITQNQNISNGKYTYGKEKCVKIRLISLLRVLYKSKGHYKGHCFEKICPL